MVAAVPTLDTVVDAVHTAVSAIGSIGTVLKCDHRFEDDVELIEVNSYIVSGSMDLWFIHADTDPFEGQGVGEQYDRYNFRIRYWSLRTNDADWAKAARTKAVSVVDVLTNNDAIFKIGSQVQLFTPTTVRFRGPDPVQIRDSARAAGQMVYEAVVEFQVEARRWS